MMPVVKGPAGTRLRILIYSLVFVPVAIAPAFTGLGGPLYLATAGLGGLMFLLLAVKLAMSRAGEAASTGEAGLYDVKADVRPARNLFAFSILYLFALFAALLGEHLAGLAPLELLR